MVSMDSNTSELHRNDILLSEFPFLLVWQDIPSYCQHCVVVNRKAGVSNCLSEMNASTRLC